MTRRAILFSTILLALVAGAFAADVTGKWVAQVEGRNGQTREMTFNLKAEGENLTGTMSSRGGDIAISEGKISGDTLSFVVTMERGGNTMKQNYTGKISGDEIAFKVEGGRGPAREFTAKRAK